MSATAEQYPLEVTDAYLDEALDAFLSDAAYVIEMVERASSALRKTTIWKARRMVKQAETGAIAQCAASFPAEETCQNTAPCGFGACRFAQGLEASIHPDSSMGKQRSRPVPCVEPTYGIDAAVVALTDSLMKDALRST